MIVINVNTEREQEVTLEDTKEVYMKVSDMNVLSVISVYQGRAILTLTLKRHMVLNE